MRQNTTIIGAQTPAGNNVAANTAVVSAANVPPGRYRINGSGRHSLADGLKITGLPGGSITIPGGAGDTVAFPSIVVDIIATSTIQVQLAQATGASDTASACLVLESASH